MKIGFVSQPGDHVVPPRRARGSVAIVTHEVAVRLAVSHQVVVFARRRPGQPAQEAAEGGVEIRRVPAAMLPFQLLDRLPSLWARRRPPFTWRIYHLPYLLRVCWQLRRAHFDVIHLFSYSQWVPIVRLFNPRATIILHMHGESLTQLPSSTIHRQLQHADGLIGCSDYITEQIVRRFPHLADRCRTLYNGVDPYHFRPPRFRVSQRPGERRRILFVGRLSPEKGLHVLAEAFNQVVQRHPRAQLHLVGPQGLLPYSYHVGLSRDPKVRELRRFYGPSGVELAGRQLIRRLSYLADVRAAFSQPAAANVRILDAVTHWELPGVYRDADLFVFPSVWPEPFGMPIVEAMASGLPVVATRGGGIPEIVDPGTTGLLVERGDAEALAAAIIALLDSDKLRHAMGRAARRHAVERFTWDHVARRLADHYHSLRGLVTDASIPASPRFVFSEMAEGP